MLDIGSWLTGFFHLFVLALVLSCCLLATMVSDENPVIDFIGVPLKVMHHFAFVAFLCLTFTIFARMCLFVGLAS